MDQPRSDRFLLRSILKQVSRSFYLTLAILPKAVRDQVGLAYLFARAADTIADTGKLDDQARLQCLHRLKAQFFLDTINWYDIQKIQSLVAPQQNNPSEQLLIEELKHCFSIYQQLTLDDQKRIGRLLPTLIEGMEFDIERFPEKQQGEVTALQAMKDLDYYTFAVAGCVGEFWTDMMCAHLSRLSHWDRAVMVPIGIRYGKGLQLINILRDLPRDLLQGRCYIPEPLLMEHRLKPGDLLQEGSAARFQPILRRLIMASREHLDQGWRYALAIPRGEVRLRLACMWPLLIGMRTLQLLLSSPNPLNAKSSIKVSRGEVYRIMAATTLTGGCGAVGTAYWGYLRKSVV